MKHWQFLSTVTCALGLWACGDLEDASTEGRSEASEALTVRLATAEPTRDAPTYEVVDLGGGFAGGGGYVSPNLHPALAEPVVYRQHVAGVTSADYADAWATWRDLGYHPAGLNAVQAAAGTRYTGLWHRDDRVVDWSSHRNLSDADYVALWNARQADGYRVLDLDAHSVSGTPRYHVIFVKDAAPKQWKSHRRLTLNDLNTKIADYRAQGFRPTRINGYATGSSTRYAAVFVKDGRTDFHAHASLSSASYGNLWAQYDAAGYAPYDISGYRQNGLQRFAGVWVKQDASVQDWASRRDMTEASLTEWNETYTKQNLVLVDVDAYLVAGQLRFSAIWHRPVTRQLVESNRPIGGDANIAALGAAVAEFSTNGNDGQRGTFGFIVQDLQTGDYVSMNLHEPFYMASTSKVLIGARVASHPDIEMDDTRFFGNTAWRGEANRGFTQADLGQPQTIQTYMSNMLIGSDTASTDMLHGVLRGLDGARGLDDWLRDVVGLQNVGEVTDICTVDKRISASADSCVNAVSCDTFVTWFRANGTLWNANQAETNCLNGLPNSHRSVENHENYYTSLANTITPAEFGRFWTKLAKGDLMDNADRAAFLQTLDPSWNDGFASAQGIFYDELGTKNGGKRRVSSQVGVMWDWNGAVGDYTDITPRYGFAFFTEDWSFEDSGDADSDGTANDTEWARAVMRAALNNSLAFLQK